LGSTKGKCSAQSRALFVFWWPGAELTKAEDISILLDYFTRLTLMVYSY